VCDTRETPGGTAKEEEGGEGEGRRESSVFRSSSAECAAAAGSNRRTIDERTSRTISRADTDRPTFRRSSLLRA